MGSKRDLARLTALMVERSSCAHEHSSAGHDRSAWACMPASNLALHYAMAIDMAARQ